MYSPVTPNYTAHQNFNLQEYKSDMFTQFSSTLYSNYNVNQKYTIFTTAPLTNISFYQDN